MYLVQLTLRNQLVPRPTDADAEHVHNVVRACLHSGSPVEHMRSRACPGTVELSLFIRGGVTASADTDRNVLIEDIRSVLSDLSGWACEAPPVTRKSDYRASRGGDHQ